jgi:hypothetical protein
MTSIIAASSNNYLSPLQQLQAELQSEVNSGAITSSDQTALSSALKDISSSLQSNGAGASASGANLPPGDLKSKIDDLIAGEVTSGKLTSAQAAELQGVFKAAFANGAGSSSGAGGAATAIGAPVPTAESPAAGAAPHGHHGHHGGPRAGDATSSTDTTSGASNTSSAIDILQQFLQSLKDSLSSSSSPSYDASGTPDTGNAGAASASALLIDYKT